MKKKLSFHFEVFCYVFQKVRKMEKKDVFLIFFIGFKNVVFYVFSYYKMQKALNLVVFCSFCDMPKIWKKIKFSFWGVLLYFSESAKNGKKRTFFYFFSWDWKMWFFMFFLLQNAKCTKFSRFLHFFDMPKMWKKIEFSFWGVLLCFSESAKNGKKGRFYTFFSWDLKMLCFMFFYYKTQNALNLSFFFIFCDMPKMWKIIK